MERCSSIDYATEFNGFCWWFTGKDDTGTGGEARDRLATPAQMRVKTAHQIKDSPRDRNPIDLTNPPNIVIFLVDDLGWNQVGYHANASWQL